MKFWIFIVLTIVSLSIGWVSGQEPENPRTLAEQARLCGDNGNSISKDCYEIKRRLTARILTNELLRVNYGRFGLACGSVAEKENDLIVSFTLIDDTIRKGACLAFWDPLRPSEDLGYLVLQDVSRNRAVARLIAPPFKGTVNPGESVVWVPPRRVPFEVLSRFPGLFAGFEFDFSDYETTLTEQWGYENSLLVQWGINLGSEFRFWNRFSLKISGSCTENG